MEGGLIQLAESLVHARPETEDEARAALEWIAAREGKGLLALIEELQAQSFVPSQRVPPARDPGCLPAGVVVSLPALRRSRESRLLTPLPRLRES